VTQKDGERFKGLQVSNIVMSCQFHIVLVGLVDDQIGSFDVKPRSFQRELCMLEHE